VTIFKTPSITHPSRIHNAQDVAIITAAGPASEIESMECMLKKKCGEISRQ